MTSHEESEGNDQPDYSADVLLVRRVLQGDRAAFDQLVEHVLPVLQRFAASRLQSHPEVVRDVVQTTLCTAIESLSKYRGEGALLSWVCGICRFEILAFFKTQRKESVVELFEESPEVEDALARVRGTSSAEQDLVAQQVKGTVHLVLDTLPRGYAELLGMKYVKGLSVVQMATALDTTEKAVESRLSRARSAFKSAYSAVVRSLEQAPQSRHAAHPTLNRAKS